MEMAPNPVYSSNTLKENNIHHGSDEAEQEEPGDEKEKSEDQEEKEDKPQNEEEALEDEEHVYEVPSL